MTSALLLQSAEFWDVPLAALQLGYITSAHTRKGAMQLLGVKRKTFAPTEFFSVCRVARRNLTPGRSQNRA